MDLPFKRMFHGNLNFFRSFDDPTRTTASFGSQSNNANQTVCEIPPNAFFVTDVAIHPYFLKYADSDRYCMQNVCISWWKKDGSKTRSSRSLTFAPPTRPTRCHT